MTKITIEFDPLDGASVQAAQTAIAAFSGEAPAKPAANKAKTTAAKPKPKPEPEKAEEPKDADANDGIDNEPAADAPEYSREDVRKALKDYSALEGKDAAIKILKDHGASSMSELKEEDFASVMKAVG